MQDPSKPIWIEDAKLPRIEKPVTTIKPRIFV
jgi:hypothetical protein